DFIRNDLTFYFEPIKSEFELKLIDDNQRHQDRIGFDTKSVNGLPSADVNTAVNGGLWTGNEGRAERGKKTLKDPKMDW
ncbi:phage portal protein, partial [Lactobacillus paracasei]|nr:phage portal protein [Lacticaseibacillus paracasei]